MLTGEPWGRVYPGWGYRVGGWRAIPGYYPGTLQDPIFSIFKAQGPTYGQIRVNSMILMRFLR